MRSLFWDDLQKRQIFSKNLLLHLDSCSVQVPGRSNHVKNDIGRYVAEREAFTLISLDYVYYFSVTSLPKLCTCGWTCTCTCRLVQVLLLNCKSRRDRKKGNKVRVERYKETKWINFNQLRRNIGLYTGTFQSKRILVPSTQPSTRVQVLRRTFFFLSERAMRLDILYWHKYRNDHVTPYGVTSKVVGVFWDGISHISATVREMAGLIKRKSSRNMKVLVLT